MVLGLSRDDISIILRSNVGAAVLTQLSPVRLAFIDSFSDCLAGRFDLDGYFKFASADIHG